MSSALILRFLAILALVLMPVGMMPASDASAAPHHAPADVTGHAQPAATGHCADMAETSAREDHHRPAPQQSDRSVDCAVACSALPSIAGVIAAPDMPPGLVHALPLAAGHGLQPEATTPPPRNA